MDLIDLLVRAAATAGDIEVSRELVSALLGGTGTLATWWGRRAVLWRVFCWTGLPFLVVSVWGWSRRRRQGWIEARRYREAALIATVAAPMVQRAVEQAMATFTAPAPPASTKSHPPLCGCASCLERAGSAALARNAH